MTAAAPGRRRPRRRRASRRAPATRTRPGSSSATASASSGSATGRATRRSCCMPTWSIVHSRHWKSQIPFLARHFTVVTFDGRGNGRSDRPTDPARVCRHRVRRRRRRGARRDRVGASGRRRAVDGRGLGAPARRRASRTACSALVFDRPVGADRAIRLIGAHDRVRGPQPTDEGWATYNATTGARDWPRFAEFFFDERLPRAALDQADRGRGRLGARDRCGDADRDQRARRASAAMATRRSARLVARALTAVAVPGAGHPRHATTTSSTSRHAATWRGARGAAGRARGRRPLPDEPRSGPLQPAAPRLHRGAAGERTTTTARAPPDRTDDGGRARLPDRPAFASARTASGSRTTSTAPATRRSCCCRRRRSSTRASGRRQVPFLSRLLPGRSRSTGAATAAPTGRPTRRPTRDDRIVARSRGRHRRDRDGPGRPRRPVRRRCLAGRPARRRSARSASLGIVAFAVGVPLLSPPHPWRVGYSLRRRAADRRGLGEDQPALLAARLRGLRAFFFGEHAARAALDEAVEDAVGWALDGSLEAMIARRATCRLPARPRGGRGDLPRPSAARCCSSTAPRTTASR